MCEIECHEPESKFIRLNQVEDLTTVNVKKIKLMRKSNYMNFLCKKTLIGRTLHYFCERRYRLQVQKIIDYMIEKRLKQKREERLNEEVYKFLNIYSENVEANSELDTFNIEAQRYINSKQDLSEQDKKDIISMLQWSTYSDQEYIMFNDDLEYISDNNVFEY